MSRPPTPPGSAPGTLTSLLDEVFRGSGDEQWAWVDGLSAGTTLGRYDLIREIGRGGSGVVWEARDRELGRRVAVKVIRRRSSGAPEKRLVAEAEVAARLSHPGIVTVLDVGRSDKGAWLVQEFLAGRTLAAKLEEGPLRLPEALKIEIKVASALAYAHGHGVVHRDLTPANVFLCEDGQVKLLDLGMAQAFGRRKLSGGTPDWMAPEQALGEPEDERVDVYALGVLLYRMVTGESPFPSGTAPEKRRAPRLETPEVPQLQDLVDRMLAPEPRDRPRDASVVEAELEALTSTLPRGGSTTATGSVRVRRRWPRWAVVAGVLLLVGVAGVVGLAAGGTRSGLAAGHGAPFVFGAVATSPACQWGRAVWIELDKEPAGAFTRNGEMGGQGLADVEGRKAWKITSDWGQLMLPLSLATLGDPFAVEAEFFIPPVTGWMRGADMLVFTEPMGGARTGDVWKGIRFGVREEPGKPTWFEWYEPDDTRKGVRDYIGTLPGTLTGRWHTIRIEGSPSAGWFRGLLDGRPLVVAHGAYDLGGSRLALGAGYGYMNPVDVAWSNVRIFSGSPECR